MEAIVPRWSKQRRTTQRKHIRTVTRHRTRTAQHGRPARHPPPSPRRLNAPPPAETTSRQNGPGGFQTTRGWRSPVALPPLTRRPSILVLGSRHDAARICCWAPAPAAVVSIDVRCRCSRSAANQPHAAAAVDRRDRPTDGRTDGNQ